MMVSTGIGMKKCCLTSRMTLTNKTISFLQQTLTFPMEGQYFQTGHRDRWRGVIALLTLWKLFLKKADHSTQEATYLNTLTDYAKLGVRIGLTYSKADTRQNFKLRKGTLDQRFTVRCFGFTAPSILLDAISKPRNNILRVSEGSIMSSMLREDADRYPELSSASRNALRVS